tara:strand:+ start:22697 stop:22936 length:240 start_codon:yes stop_codon:yes gene_type:complete
MALIEEIQQSAILNDPRINDEDLAFIDELTRVSQAAFSRQNQKDDIFRAMNLEDHLNKLNLAIKSILAHRLEGRQTEVL